jgi:hypothetical protein
MYAVRRHVSEGSPTTKSLAPRLSAALLLLTAQCLPAAPPPRHWLHRWSFVHLQTAIAKSWHHSLRDVAPSHSSLRSIPSLKPPSTDSRATYFGGVELASANRNLSTFSLGYKGPVEIFLAFLATSQAARLLVRVKDIDGRPVMHILAQFKASGELHKMAPADQRENVDSRDACPCGKSDSY